MLSLQVGQIIAEKYQLEGPLAKGGMGSIWIARHQGFKGQVAIKFMDPQLAADHDARRRFEREAAIVAQIQSQHVAHIKDFGFDNGTPYMVMELLDGESLQDRLTRVGRLSLAECAKILTQAAKAISKAHALGVVHRDLKPANLFLARIDDGEILKVLDFGIAKMNDTDLTKTGMVPGSLHYMSPEQTSGSPDLDLRSDVWSLGVILFQALTGKQAFPGTELAMVIRRIAFDPLPIPSHVHGALPPAIDAFFTKALCRDPAGRFASVTEMAERFAGLVASLENDAPTQQWAQPSAPAVVPTETIGVAAPLTPAAPAAPAPARELPGTLLTKVSATRVKKRAAVGGAAVAAGGLVVLALGAWLLSRALAGGGTPASAVPSSSAPSAAPSPASAAPSSSSASSRAQPSASQVRGKPAVGPRAPSVAGPR